MTSETLKPNIQVLQQDVIDLLQKISNLMGRAKDSLCSDGSGDKYGQFQEEIAQARLNVKELELRMAIVAPMKAGKSTIINAIVGQELLPSRNAAMTTLPTKIVFKAELSQPTLNLSPEILSVFQETLLALRTKIQELGEEQMQQKVAQYPHLMELIQEIKDSVGFPNHAKTFGREEIIKVLTGLNDIVRLCSVLIPFNDPLAKLTEVPTIETSFLRSENVEKSDKLGNLVIVDTPGPNEAGDNLRLTAVVAEQLQKSSIVLIVLDFTQLNNQAAEGVKRQVEPIIELIGKENLYVLVNKVDQRRKGDMTPEQVKEFVFADLKLSESSDTDRVFEVSAIQAFTATQFLLELQQNPEIELLEMKTVEVLAQEAFGIDWEEELEEATIESLRKKADRLQKKSGFQLFLDKAINALMETAAPRCMLSALNLSRNRLLELRDDLKLRSSAIAQDEERLRLEIGALEADLKRLELCRNKLREVDKIRSGLQQNLNQILELLKKEARVSIKDYFIEGDFERGDLIKKTDMKAREFFLTPLASFPLFPDFISQRIKSTLEYKTSGIAEFKTEQEAKNFANEAVAWAKQRAENLLSGVRKHTGKEIEKARQGLTNFLEKETRPIIERAQQRLNEAFDIDLELPPPTLESSNDLYVSKPSVKTETRYIDQGYGTKTVKKRAWHHWLWIVPFDEEVRYKKPDKKVNYYTVYFDDLVTQINYAIESNVQNISQGITEYLDEDFKDTIDSYFELLDDYLRNYRDSLRQAQQDQQLSLEEKHNLVNDLNSLVPDATKKIEDTDKLTQRTQELM
jgi:GTPase Era involved in 16S rRNA processing